MSSPPVVIAVAITGSVPRKKNNSAVPVTVAEQIESAHQAFEAGASLCHIHVRNEDESPFSDPDKFAAVHRNLAVVMDWALARGADAVRTGLEDNIRHSKDRLAASNAELVGLAARAVRRHGRRVASPAEARAALGIEAWG